MKEITKSLTVFIADDGKEFNSKEECVKYEQEHREEKVFDNFFKMTKDIYEMCRGRASCDCGSGSFCPFYVFNEKGKESHCLFNPYPDSWRNVTTYQGEKFNMPLIKED